MDIPLVNTTPASAPNIVAPVSAPAVAATAQAQTVAALLAQTTVDLSPMGRFLSAIALFQKRLLEQQASQADSEASQELVAALVSSVVALADSANTLQASAITGTSDDQSLATLFGRQFDAQTGTAGDSEGLAAIGLAFTEDGVLNVDAEALQTALTDDPAATTGLLTRAGAAFATLAGIAPGSGADISALLGDQASVFDLPGQSAPAAFEALPAFADPALPPGSDDAFLQELLAETPRPALALDQAPPPAISEAGATFAAQRAADAPLPANLPEAATDGAPAANPAAVAASAPTDFAGQAGAPAIAAQPAPASLAQPGPVSLAQPAPVPAAPTQAALDAARAANLRYADSVAAERDADARTINARNTERAAPAEQAEAQSPERAPLARATDRAAGQQRPDRAREATEPAAQELDEAAPLRERPGAAIAQPAAPADATLQTTVPRPPQQQQLNNAQQLARDPSIAAAIAAYNLNTGPFAALNGRPELAAIRPKVVPAVETVTKVAAIETDAATGESARPFR
jgi:hypothetical protein